MKTLITCLSLTLVVMNAWAGSISGYVYNQLKEPIPGVAVRIVGTPMGAVTNVNGRFSLKGVKEGSYTLEFSSIGYQKYQRKVTVESKSNALEITLEDNVEELESVVIEGNSESRIRSEQPIQMTSINLKEFQFESTDVINVLDRSPGVRVRQNGGLGSSANIQLNGLSGSAVRQYYGGIPLELLGGGISLNNIPVNAISRIDVYKGVMPIDVGTDALAGGINIVPREVYATYLDASYSVGSFNTHVVSANGAKLFDNNMFVAFNGFFNYADNNYTMRNIEARVLDDNGFETFAGTQDIERFHNQHQSSFANLEVGANDLKWADRIVFSTGFSQRFDEIQHGARVGGRPAGEAETDNRAFFQSIRYEKRIKEKLNISY